MKRTLKSAELDTWPGFEYDVVLRQDLLFLDLNLKFMIVRPESCLDLIGEIISLKPLDAKDKQETAIRDQLVGKIVVTSYNNCIYEIAGVDFGKRPCSSESNKTFAAELQE
jgi:hypothetical protein